MKRPHLSCLTLLLCLTILSPAAVLADTPRQKARKLLRAGSALYNKGNYAGALEKYRAAKTHLPGSFKIDLNIAHTLVKLGLPHFPEAARFYEHFLARDDVPKKYKVDARRQMQTLKAQLASLFVDCSVKGAKVMVDGKSMGATPLKTRIYLTPREKPYAIKVESGGLQPFAQELVLKANEHLIIKVIFAKPKPVTKPPPSPEPPKPAPQTPVPLKPAPVEQPEPPVKPQPTEPTSEPTTDDDPDDLAVPPTTSGFFGNLLVGPAWTDYGDPSLTVGTGVELGGELGYHWRGPFGNRWLGFDVHATVLYTPVSDTSVDQEMGFINVFGGGSVRFYFGSAFAALRFSVGPSILFGATEKSFFFDGATSVSGAFANVAVRPSVVLGWTVWKGLTVSLNPSVEYMPRIESFSDSISGVTRFILAVGLGWQG